MKLTGTVDSHMDQGDAVLISITNTRRKFASYGEPYVKGPTFRTSYRTARKSYPVGATVEIVIKPKK